MSASARKGSESVNEEGQRERRVETVDYRSSVGHSQEQRPVQVVHESVDTSTSGGVLADAAAAVASTLQSAREAISGNEDTSNNSIKR